MGKRCIAVIDSGIGGLTVLSRLIKEMQGEKFIYFGDNENVPYGEKTDSELISLAFKNIFMIKEDFELKGVVLGCNTLSMSVLDKIKKVFDFPIFGVFPPIVLDRKEKILLLSTERTAEEYLKYNLPVTVSKLPALATIIEKNASDVSRIKIEEFLPYRKGEFGTVILGCTHYEFIKNQIFNHLKPQRIICGQDYTAKFVEKFFKNKKYIAKTRQNKVIFYGKTSSYNDFIWHKVVKYFK